MSQIDKKPAAKRLSICSVLSRAFFKFKNYSLNAAQDQKTSLPWRKSVHDNSFAHFRI